MFGTTDTSSLSIDRCQKHLLIKRSELKVAVDDE